MLASHVCAFHVVSVFREIPKQMETETKPKIVKKTPPAKPAPKEEPKDGEKTEEGWVYNLRHPSGIFTIATMTLLL